MVVLCLPSKAGDHLLIFEKFDFSACVMQICKDMSLIENKGIKLNYEISDGIFLEGERELLERLISNLIANAYKYGKENGEINVTLKKSKNDSEIHLSVSDNGIGIAENEKEKIFDRFYRSDKSRSESGTGLGLSLALEIARLHNGEILLDSTLGSGSTFTFVCPSSVKNK